MIEVLLRSPCILLENSVKINPMLLKSNASKWKQSTGSQTTYWRWTFIEIGFKFAYDFANYINPYVAYYPTLNIFV